MSETRRDLFATTIVGALGGLVAGAVSGFAVVRESKTTDGEQSGKGGGSSRPFVSPVAGSVVAVYGLDQTTWYFFKFAPNDPSQCQLLSAPSGTLLPGTTPSPTNLIDTFTWCSTLVTKPVPTNAPINIRYNTTGGSIAVSFNGNYLDAQSLSNLLHAFADMNQIIGGSWNEIGKN